MRLSGGNNIFLKSPVVVEPDFKGDFLSPNPKPLTSTTSHISFFCTHSTDMNEAGSGRALEIE